MAQDEDIAAPKKHFITDLVTMHTNKKKHCIRAEETKPRDEAIPETGQSDC
jgi:hypothetical protein